MIGNEPVARTEVIKKLWDYIKANGLQDADEQARDQRRRQAAAGVRQAAGHDVRAGRHRRQASERMKGIPMKTLLAVALRRHPRSGGGLRPGRRGQCRQRQRHRRQRQQRHHRVRHDRRRRQQRRTRASDAGRRWLAGCALLLAEPGAEAARPAQRIDIEGIASAPSRRSIARCRGRAGWRCPRWPTPTTMRAPSAAPRSAPSTSRWKAGCPFSAWCRAWTRTCAPRHRSRARCATASPT